MNDRTIAEEWFRIAEMDIRTAEYLRNMRPVPIEIICYHCQQSAEKYLKGFLALNGEEIQKTHDLGLLNKTCQKYDLNFVSIEEDCLLLTNYGVLVRYPLPMDIDEADMKVALKAAQKIRSFIGDKEKQF